MREGRYWEKEERRCRLCEGKEETWEHMWKRCREWGEGGGNWQEAVRWVLGKEGEGERWLRELEGETGRRGGRGNGDGEKERDGMGGGVTEGMSE